MRCGWQIRCKSSRCTVVERLRVTVIADTHGEKASVKGPNLAAVLLKQDKMEIPPVPLPRKPKANEVVVAMKAVGICGSDVHVSGLLCNSLLLPFAT